MPHYHNPSYLLILAPCPIAATDLIAANLDQESSSPKHSTAEPPSVQHSFQHFTGREHRGKWCCQFLVLILDLQSELQSYYATRLSHLRPAPWLQEIQIDLEQSYVQLYLQNKCVHLHADKINHFQLLYSFNCRADGVTSGWSAGNEASG
jgi:hypothetical protein